MTEPAEDARHRPGVEPFELVEESVEDDPFADIEDPRERESARLQAGQIVEDALKSEEAEFRRRMRPIEDAAALDPADPDYAEKLQVLVEEVKANMCAADKAAAGLAKIAERLKSPDHHWRQKRLAKMKEKAELTPAEEALELSLPGDLIHNLDGEEAAAEARRIMEELEPESRGRALLEAAFRREEKADG